MASKELIEQIETVLEAADIAGDGYDVTAKNIITTVRAALQEPTGAMLDELRLDEYFTNRALAVRWNAALNTSPLGEQSE